jgi:hypothetical protein
MLTRLLQTNRILRAQAPSKPSTPSKGGGKGKEAAPPPPAPAPTHVSYVKQVEAYKSALTRFKEKYGDTGELQKLEQRESIQKRIGKLKVEREKEIKLKGKRRITEGFRDFVQEWMSEFWDENPTALRPIFSMNAEKTIEQLFMSDPYYWNPIRLASLFDCSPVWMMVKLWDIKLYHQAMRKGDIVAPEDVPYIPPRNASPERWKLLRNRKNPVLLIGKDGFFRTPKKSDNIPDEPYIDNISVNEAEKLRKEGKETIVVPNRSYNEHDFGFEIYMLRNQIANLVGEVDFPKEFKNVRSKESFISKHQNTWYFMPPGINNQELLHFVRSRNSKRYRESPRIPPIQYPPPKKYEKFLPKGFEPKVAVPPGRAKVMMYVDSSECYDMYTRPIMVQDSDNNRRDPTWDERREYFDSRRIIKRAYALNEHMIIQPDNEQPDGQAVAHKPPERFIVKYQGDWLRGLSDYANIPIDKLYERAENWNQDRRDDQLSRMEGLRPDEDLLDYPIDFEEEYDPGDTIDDLENDDADPTTNDRPPSSRR